MCTITFIAQRSGYCLGMNRDEKLDRVTGVPPMRNLRDGRRVVCPSEPGGGTWIAANDSGATLALINWYSVAGRAVRSSVSRGEVVQAVGAADSFESAHARLMALPLQRIKPFRLVGIFPASRDVIEWRWNMRQLVRRKAPWRTQQWISSGYDERTARRVRASTFRRALEPVGAPRLGWLRRLHSSHTPQVGPFSTCMHRSDAATVSYTEIAVTPRLATMRYHAGTPCTRSGPAWPTLRLKLKP